MVSCVSGPSFLVKLTDTHTASCKHSVVIHCSQFDSNKPSIFAAFGFMRKDLCSHFSLVFESSTVLTHGISNPPERTNPCVAFCAFENEVMFS